MTHELLNDFGVLSIGIQNRPKRMTEGVPVLELIASVESVTKDQRPTDPFALTKDFLAGL
jgi:hypothetical protein